MRRPRLLLAGMLLPGVLAAQQKLQRAIPIAPDASIRITNTAGVVRITGSDADSIVVTGALPAGASFFLGGKGQYAKLGVERRDESLPGPGATLDIRLPRRAKVSIRTVSAGIEVTGLSGELELVTVAGNIRVDGALRLLLAESMEGTFDVRGPIEVSRLKGGSGAMTLAGLRGDVMAGSVGGPITVRDGAVTRAHLETVSGSIEYEGSLAPRGTLESVTHSGDVTLRLPADLGAEFELESIDGSVDPGGFARRTKGRSLSFVTRDGGSRVVVRSFKGVVTLRP